MYKPSVVDRRKSGLKDMIGLFMMIKTQISWL